MKLSKRLDNFPEYIFSKLNKEIAKIEEKSGKKVLNLGIGSPTFPPSTNYVKKLQEFFAEEKSHLYPGYGPKPFFTEAMLDWYEKRFSVTLEDSEIFPLLGAKDGVSHINLALLDAGDEVVVPDPGYPAYQGAALMVNAKPVAYQLSEDNDFKLDVSAIEAKISSKTKFIWVNFPSNPTGQIVEKDKLEELIRLAKEKQVWIVYDNAYSEVTFGDYTAPSILEIDGAKDVAVELNSFSKMFSFAGYRMGWVAGNSELIAALAKIKSQIDSGMSLPLQKIGAYALNNPDPEWHQAMLTEYQRRMHVIGDKLEKLGLKVTYPKGSLYLWAKIPDSEKDSWSYSMKLLEEKHVLLTPGIAYGENGDRYIRASFSSDIENIDKYL